MGLSRGHWHVLYEKQKNLRAGFVRSKAEAEGRPVSVG